MKLARHISIGLLALAAGALGSAGASAPITNTAGASHQAPSGAEESVASNQVVTSVNGDLGFLLGPQGRPAATEYPSADDRQSAEAYAGAPLRMRHAVQNAGTVADTPGLGLETPLPAGWVARWLAADLNPLADTNGDGAPDPGRLAPGAVVEVVLELTPPAVAVGDNGGAGWAVVSRAWPSSRPGSANRTLDSIPRVRPLAEAWRLQKSVGPEGTVLPGASLAYTVEVANATDFEQTNVVVMDGLSPLLGPPSEITDGTVEDATRPGSRLEVSAVYDAPTRALSWTLPRLPAGARVRLAFAAKALETAPEASVIENAATVNSRELPPTLASNTVTTGVMPPVLALEKAALAPTVAVGDRLGYRLRLRNTSSSLTLKNVELADDLPAGLAYVAGSSRLDGSSFADSAVSEANGAQRLVWALPELAPGRTVTLEFAALATPRMGAALVNRARAQGRAGPQGEVVASSNAATAATRRVEGAFRSSAVVLGRVYLDRDGNGRFEIDRDEPFAGARLYLADGRYAMSDADGRYSFPEVAPGVTALRLDPLTAPHAPASVPTDDGRPGTRRVRVLEPGLYTHDFPLLEPSGTAAVSLGEGGEVTVRLSLQDALENVGELVASTPRPAGTALVPGSGRLDGAELPEPLASGERLQWVLPARGGVLRYRLSGELPPANVALEAGLMLWLPRLNAAPVMRVLQGEPLPAAPAAPATEALGPIPAPRARVGALLLEPLPGTLYRDRDAISITVDLPLGAQNVALTVNGSPVGEDRLGERGEDAEANRLTLGYHAVELREGENEIVLTAEAGDERLTDRVVVRLAGDVAAIRLLPSRPFSTDAADGPELTLELRDAHGNPPADGLVTLEVTPEPATDDADPLEPGFQVRAVDGQARVPLSSLAGQGAVRARAFVGSVTASAEFPVSAGLRPAIVVGAAGVQIGFGADGFSASGSLRLFGRGEVADGWLLTVAANLGVEYANGAFSAGGSLLPPANPFERFPLLGDSASRGADAASGGPLYLRLERGGDFLLYGRFNPGFTGALLGVYDSTLDGLHTVVSGENLRVSGFAALRPVADRKASLRGDGTSLYRLPDAPVLESSERLAVVVRDRLNPTLKLSERALERLAEYTLDYETGLVLLQKALPSFDEAGNPVFLEAEYATAGSNRLEARGGLQASLALGELSLNATALRFREDAPTYFGVGASLRSGGFAADLETGWSGAAAVAGGATFAGGPFEASLRYRDAAPGYVGPDGAAPGRDLSVAAALRPLPGLAFGARYSLSQPYATGITSSSLALEGRAELGNFSASLGVLGQFGAVSETYLTGGLGSTFGPLKLSLVGRAPLGAGTAELGLVADLTLAEGFGLTYQSLYALGTGHRGTLGARGRFGSTNLAATYELPGVGGDAGRARIGVDTAVPITATLSAQFGGELVARPGAGLEGNANVGLLYVEGDARASGRAQLSVGERGVKGVYTLGAVLAPLPGLALSPSLEYTNGPDGEGGRFSAAAAYRAETWSLLTRHTARTGVFAPGGDELSGELLAAYDPSGRFGLRSGVAYRVSGGVFTGQLSAGATVFVTDLLGFGASASYLFQPASGTGALAFGIEASARLATDLVLTGGVNLVGFQGLGSASTAPGVYLRLDFKFDERTLGAEGR